MVAGISNQMGQYAASALSSSSKESSSTDTIKSEVQNSGQSYTAQQIADKYGISLSEAQQILSEIEKENNSSGSSQNSKSDIPDSPQLEKSEPPSTITYRV